MGFWDLGYPASPSSTRMSLSTLEWSDRLQIANHSHTTRVL